MGVNKNQAGAVANEFRIANKSGITRTKRTGTVVREIAVATFDTAALDSAGVANTTTAAHGLGVYLPTKAIVINAWVDVITTFTSATDAATIALKVQGANDLTAAIAISTTGDVWDAGIHGCLPGSYAEATVAGDSAILDAARKAASYIKTSAVRELTATVAVEALTAGKLNLYVEYVLSE
jgi:hypothetical protein